MACSAFKLSQCIKNQIAYKYAVNYSFVFNRYYCIKSDNEDKNLKTKTEEKNKDKLDQDVYVKEATQEHKLSDKQSEFSTEESKEAAKKKLLSLLSEVNVVSDKPPRFNLNLAKPLKRPSKKERFPDLFAKKSPPDEEIKLAVKAVASNIKGDPKVIESELQQKLTSINLIKEEPTEELSEREEDHAEKQADSILNEKESKNLMSSVEKIASTVTGSPPQSELTNRLLRLALDSKISTEQRKSVSETLSGMKIEGKSSDIWEQKRATDRISSSMARYELKKSMDERDPSKTGYELRRNVDQINPLKTKSVPVRPQMKQRIDLFGSSPLGIFPSPAGETIGAKNALWEKLQEKEMRLLVQFAPANAFEEMILWTEQGKHWKLPIDNEIDMGAEENVGFHEHVFLERHLDGFPTKGPIRHFMELVVVGLSKNPYITVDRKIENINWFRDYFREKENILKEAGVLEG